MATRDFSRLVARPAAAAALTVSLVAPLALGLMLVHVAGFFPATGLATALRLGGIALATTPGFVLALETRRALRIRDETSRTGDSAQEDCE